MGGSIVNKKITASVVLSVAALALTGTVLFASPRISKEKKEFYENKRIEHNNENNAIGKETLKVAQMPDSAEKKQKEKELKERNIKFKEESTKAMEEMQQDGYVNDEEILDSNAKLIKELEEWCKLKEFDIRTSEDQELIDFETKQFNKIKNLLKKVKKSDDSEFGVLLEEYNQMIKSFKEERPIFEEQYRKKHNIR